MTVCLFPAGLTAGLLGLADSRPSPCLGLTSSLAPGGVPSCLVWPIKPQINRA